MKFVWSEIGLLQLDRERDGVADGSLRDHGADRSWRVWRCDSRKPQSGEEEVRLRLHFFAFGCVCIWFAFIQILRTNGSFGSWIAGTC